MARGKQIEFQGLHGHNKAVEKAVVIFTIACIVFAIIAIQVVG
ncbi:MAG: hypothetical protein OXH86_10750 [Acidimicrobiaceae bacterium]|nr:hypothetical protein [Acidimicrobiaceae bacterium]MDE0133721.1 hypothetical protein [Acidimicrobiaceae bacterium]MDE0497823.1 hypothetical protein [Acidimicrobiaceae bacterium]MDE0676039.1 hypothetical protein [Acidimicrobiaceae bacterium]